MDFIMTYCHAIKGDVQVLVVEGRGVESAAIGKRRVDVSGEASGHYFFATAKLDEHGIPYRDLCFLGQKPEVQAENVRRLNEDPASWLGEITPAGVGRMLEATQLADMAAEEDCTYRATAALFQDFSVRCRMQRIGACLRQLPDRLVGERAGT